MQVKTPVIASHLPGSTSVKCLVHHAQLIKSGNFAKYDYGYVQNFLVYHSADPPNYDLSLITCRVYLMYSTGDGMSVTSNVKLLTELLPNVISVFKIPDESFSHVDFFLSPNLGSLLYKKLFAEMDYEERRLGQVAENLV